MANLSLFFLNYQPLAQGRTWPVDPDHRFSVNFIPQQPVIVVASPEPITAWVVIR